MNIRVENRCKSPRAERLALSERISVRSGSSLLLSLLLIAFSDLWFLCSAGRYPSIQGQTQSCALCLHTALRVERRARKLMFALRNYILPLLLYLLFVDRRKEKKKSNEHSAESLNVWYYQLHNLQAADLLRLTAHFMTKTTRTRPQKCVNWYIFQIYQGSYELRKKLRQIFCNFSPCNRADFCVWERFHVIMHIVRETLESAAFTII